MPVGAPLPPESMEPQAVIEPSDLSAANALPAGARAGGVRVWVWV